MSNEIKVTASLKCSNGYFEQPQIGSTQLKFDQTAIGGDGAIVEIGTSEEDIDLSEITTLGWCYMRNLDTTNYVEWGKKDGSGNMQAIGRLEAGEPALFRMNPGVTLRMKANTAACKVQIIVLED